MSEKSRVSLIFTVLCILVGILVAASGIYIFIGGFWRSITAFVIGCYFIIFGVFIVLLEIVFPAKLIGWFGFYTYYLGKGLLFILIGLLLLGDRGFFLFAGIVVIAVGIILCVVHFFFGRPAPLVNRESHAHNKPQA